MTKAILLDLDHCLTYVEGKSFRELNSGPLHIIKNVAKDCRNPIWTRFLAYLTLPPIAARLLLSPDGNPKPLEVKAMEKVAPGIYAPSLKFTTEDVSPNQKLIDYVNKLKQKEGVSVYVVTSSPKYSAKVYLDSTNLQFDGVIGLDLDINKQNRGIGPNYNDFYTRIFSEQGGSAAKNAFAQKLVDEGYTHIEMYGNSLSGDTITPKKNKKGKRIRVINHITPMHPTKEQYKRHIERQKEKSIYQEKLYSINNLEFQEYSNFFNEKEVHFLRKSKSF